MNDIDQRLTSLLRGAAERTHIHPDIRAVVDETSEYPRLIERPQHRFVKPVTMSVAASVVALAVGLAVAIPTMRDRTVDPGSGVAPPLYRNHTDVYPLLTDVPDWAGQVAPTFQPAPQAGRGVWALVARRGQDSLKSPIIISTGDRIGLDVADGAAVEDRAGRPAYLYEEPGGRRTVLVTDDSGEAVLTLSGVTPTDVLLEVLAGVTSHGSGSSSTFTIDEVPVGHNVVVEPTVQPEAVDAFGIATTPTAESTGTLSIEVVTDLSDLRFYSSRAGAAELRSIFIGGTGEQLTGWYATPSPGTVVLAWKLDPGVTLVLTATRDHLTASEAIEVAHHVVLTDEETWRAAYDPAAASTATDTSDRSG